MGMSEFEAGGFDPQKAPPDTHPNTLPDTHQNTLPFPPPNILPDSGRPALSLAHSKLWSAIDPSLRNAVELQLIVLSSQRDNLRNAVRRIDKVAQSSDDIEHVRFQIACELDALNRVFQDRSYTPD